MVDLTGADSSPASIDNADRRFSDDEAELLRARQAVAASIARTQQTDYAQAGRGPDGLLDEERAAIAVARKTSQGERQVRAAASERGGITRHESARGGRVERPNRTRTGVFQPVRRQLTQIARAVRSTVTGAELTNTMMRMPVAVAQESPEEEDPEPEAEVTQLGTPPSMTMRAVTGDGGVPGGMALRSRSVPDMAVGRNANQREAASRQRVRAESQREDQRRRDGRVAPRDAQGRFTRLPGYDRTRATVPGDHRDHRRLHPDRPRMAPPMTVEAACAGDSLEARRLKSVPVVRTEAERQQRKRTREESHRARCNHLGGRGWLQNAARMPSDLPFVRSREEVAVQARLSRLVDYVLQQSLLGWPDAGLPRSDLVTADRPFDGHWFLGPRAEHWSQDYNFEHRRRARAWRRTGTGEDESRPGWFVGRSNVEFDDVPASLREEVYLQVDAEFEEMEVSQLLCVSNPLLVIYHASIFLSLRNGTRTDAALSNWLRIALETEYAVHALVWFLHASVHGLRAARCPDPRAYPNFPGVPVGRLCELPGRLRNIITAIGFFSIVAETTFEPHRAWLAYETSRRINWTQTTGFLVFDPDTSSVYGLAAHMDEQGRVWREVPAEYRVGYQAPTAAESLRVLKQWVERSERRDTWRSAGPWRETRPYRSEYGPLYETDPPEPLAIPLRTPEELEAAIPKAAPTNQAVSVDLTRQSVPAILQETAQDLLRSDTGNTESRPPAEAGEPIKDGTRTTASGRTETIPGGLSSSGQTGAGNTVENTPAGGSVEMNSVTRQTAATAPDGGSDAGAPRGSTSDPVGLALAALQEGCRSAGRDVPTSVEGALALALALVRTRAERRSGDASMRDAEIEEDLRVQLDRAEAELVEERVQRRTAEARAQTYEETVQRLRTARASDRRRSNVTAENAVARTVLTQDRDRVGQVVTEEIGTLRTSFATWLEGAEQRLAAATTAGPTVEELRASGAANTGGTDGISNNGTGSSGAAGGTGVGPSGTGA